MFLIVMYDKDYLLVIGMCDTYYISWNSFAVDILTFMIYHFLLYCTHI